MNVSDDDDVTQSNAVTKEMLELQLSEIEMLKSMYPDACTLDDPGDVDVIRKFINDEIDYDSVNVRLAFTIKVDAEDIQGIELVCRFPHGYPLLKPETVLRSPFPRISHRLFSEELHGHLEAMETGEICVYSLIEWIRVNASKYNIKHDPQKAALHIIEEDNLFVRMWIYSHHIYSKFKRKDIIDWANELKLTGFSMPGKPGVICIEGMSRSVEEFWHRIRRLNWKRLVMKEKYEEDIKSRSIHDLYKFPNFEEKNFDVRAGKGREYHMNLGLFYKFLEQHDCAEIFSLYFGVDGKTE